DLLLRARALGRRLEARVEGQRGGLAARVALAVVGDRAHAAPARTPGRARLPAARADLAGAGRSDLAVRGTPGLPVTGRHVPLPHGPRGVRGRDLLVASLPRAAHGGRRALRGPPHRRPRARVRARHARTLPVRRLPQAQGPDGRAEADARAGAALRLRDDLRA